MPNYKHPILAKPSGVTLEQHKFNVMSEGALLSEQMPFTCEKYENIVGKKLSRRLKIACELHDDGKNTERWQTACQKDYELFLKWKANHNGSFEKYAKEKQDEAGKNIRLASVRHELQSLSLNASKNIPIVLQAAIAAHHGKLSFRFHQRWEDEGFFDMWNSLQRESNHASEKLDLEHIAKKQYEYAGPRGLLQLADHRASAKEDGDHVPDITRFTYQFPHKSKRGVQNLVEQHWKDDLILLRAPTGAGKTDASLLWASLQIQNKRADKLVIAMPTRFTSNALSISVAENLSDTGLYHSSAWFNKFQTKIDNGEIEKRKAEKKHEFARLLETPVTVCTIDHLLMSLTLTREDHQLITFNLANACLVIDEADFYDDFTQANILILLQILKYWNVPVLLMSASLPESVLYDYKNIGYAVDEILEDKSDNTRDRFEIKEIREYTEPSDVEDLLYLIMEKENGIIYANTVEKAISYYKWFEEYSVNKNVILYHSRFTEPDKEKKESQIIAALGREAWGNGKAKGIVIMTQIGEMSINISADIMISEICPIDRLTQRAGRICRFDKSKIGDLYILKPQKNNDLYPAPYGNFDMQAKTWTSCEYLLQTIKIIETKIYNAENLVALLNQIYSKKREYSAVSIENAKMLKNYYIANWLINPQQISNIDDADANFWKSRNIAPQGTVYVKKTDSYYFSNYFEFQKWKISNSVELPIYLIDKIRKQHKMDSLRIRIKDEEECIYVIREGFYNNNIGVVFMEENQIL